MIDEIFTILYGDSSGKIDIITEDIKEGFKRFSEQSFAKLSSINIEESEFIKDPSIVVNELFNIGFFKNFYFVNINKITDKSYQLIKTIVEKIISFDDKNFCRFVLKTDSLAKNTKIKSLTTDKNFSKFIKSISCYESNDFSFEIFEKKLNSSRIKFEKKIMQYIFEKCEKKIENVSEFIDSVALYSLDKEDFELNEEVVEKIISNTNNDYDIESEIVNYLLSGDYKKFYKILKVLVLDAGEDVFIVKVLTSIFKKIIEINQLIKNGSDISDAVKKKVYIFSKFPLYTKLVKKYNIKFSNNIIKKTTALEFFLKNNQSNSNIIFSVLDYFFLKLATIWYNHSICKWMILL